VASHPGSKAHREPARPLLWQLPPGRSRRRGRRPNGSDRSRDGRILPKAVRIQSGRVRTSPKDRTAGATRLAPIQGSTGDALTAVAQRRVPQSVPRAPGTRVDPTLGWTGHAPTGAGELSPGGVLRTPLPLRDPLGDRVSAARRPRFSRTAQLEVQAGSRVVDHRRPSRRRAGNGALASSAVGATDRRAALLPN
jgi:hypothetical protein